MVGSCHLPWWLKEDLDSCFIDVLVHTVFLFPTSSHPRGFGRWYPPLPPPPTKKRREGIIFLLYFLRLSASPQTPWLPSLFSPPEPILPQQAFENRSQKEKNFVENCAFSPNPSPLYAGGRTIYLCLDEGREDQGHRKKLISQNSTLTYMHEDCHDRKKW